MVVGVSGPQAFIWTDRTGMIGIGPQGPYTYALPAGIDGSGNVVGNYAIRGSSSHLFYWSRSRGTTDYPRGFGTDGSALVTAMSDNGYAVGFSTPLYGPEHAFIWRYGEDMRDLGVLPGEVSSEAWGVNDRGEVVGRSGAHAVAWDRYGHIRDLGLGRATSINRQGWIIGTRRESNMSDTLTLWLENAAVRVPSACSSLEGAALSTYTRLNDDGIVAATCTGSRDLSRPTASQTRSYLWSPGHRVRRLPTLPGRDSRVVDLNERGQIAGTATTRSGSPSNSHPVLWTFHR
jgi:probable HAF family extracellular repeat protein